MNPLLLIACLLAGLAGTLLIWSLRDVLVAKYKRDQEWLTASFLRFSPKPINARNYTIAYYLTFFVLLLLINSMSPNILFSISLWLFLLLFPNLFVEYAWKRRRKKIDQQLAATIASMCNSIRAGLTLVQAIQRLGEQAPEPVRTEFAIMAAHYSYGADLESTIREAKRRLALPNFNLFASAVLLNREMGGDVADTLQRISISLEKLKQMRQTVEAHTSEGRTNIKFLCVAPAVMLLMLSTVDLEGVTLLFSTPQGYAVLLTAGILTATGIYFANRITRSEI